MKRVGGWLGASKPHASSQSLSALDEPAALEDAMTAVIHILNDDVDTADVELSRGSSPFHKVSSSFLLSAISSILSSLSLDAYMRYTQVAG